MNDLELLAAVAKARADGIYEDDPDWAAIDTALAARGYDLGFAAEGSRQHRRSVEMPEQTV